MDAAASRRSKLARLAADTFDVVVIGGGINGAGIAREAALRGFRTALVDKGDFAAGTSSRSSKLIHGGVRYLEHGHVGLVLEASRERDLLRRRLAPHLVRPLPFFFPIFRGGPLGLWRLRAGLFAYDLLAAFRNIRRHRAYDAAGALDLEPELRSEGLLGGALYYDCITDDARLVLETILAAEHAGAVCLNYVALESFEKSEGRICGTRLRDLEGGGTFRVAARTIVNATGPWLDRVRILDDPSAVPILRPTKGVHIVVPRERLGNRHAVVMHAVHDRRVLFAIPWEDQALVGTTDTDFIGDPDQVSVEAEDVDYLLESANFHFPRAGLAARDVVSTFAGLRPLVAAGEGVQPSALSREEEVLESSSGLVSLGGGKLTTFRRVAIRVVDRLVAPLEKRHGIRARRRSGTNREPLPGGEDFVTPGNGNAEPIVRFLASRYGFRARQLLDRIERSPELARPITPKSPDLRAQAWYGAAAEMAIRVEDVLRRRTQVALRSAEGAAAAADDVARLMAEPLGWDGATVRRRAAEYGATFAEPPKRREA